MYALRLLFWLKWKLTLRGYRRNTSAAIGALFLFLLVFPLAIALGFIFANSFLEIAPPYNGHLLRSVLLGIYFLWVMGPILGYAFNDAYDITKLFVYPLSLRQIFAGAILGSLLDLPVLFLLPSLIAVFVGFTTDGATFLLNLIAVGLYLLHTLSLSQAFLLASAGILRSRRFRDLATVLIPVIWIAWYFFTQALTGRTGSIDWRIFLESRAWDILNYLPPGLTARAVYAGWQGEWAAALGYLTALAAFTLATVYLVAWVLQKVYAGDVLRRPARAVASVSAAPSAPSDIDTSPLFRRLSSVVRAVMDKEIKYFLRDPYFRIMLMNLVYILCVTGFALLRMGQDPISPYIGPVVAWAATGIVLLTEMQLVCNVFGTEGGAAALLFLFPCSRREILIGKNLAIFFALSIINLVYVLVTTALCHVLPWYGLLFFWMEMAILVCISLGNIASIYFPYRMVMRGWRIRQQSATRGCGYSLIYLVIMFVGFLLMIPVLAALVLPTLTPWIAPEWLLLTVPLAIAYAGGLYLFSLAQAEPLLMEREVEIIAKVGQED